MERNYSKVAIIKSNSYEYPDRITLFRPGQKYPEYPFDETSDFNLVYDQVRESFHLLEYDHANYGTKAWNPLGEFIQPSNTVLIKPNLVMESNQIEENGTDCLYTNPSVVAAVIDYVIIALKGEGKIIVGDAPMQECKFDILLDESGYSKLIEWYKNKGINIDIVDFRELTSEVVNGIHIQRVRDDADGKVIDLGMESEFSNVDHLLYDKLRVTNYDPDILIKHHSKEKNEYYVSNYILAADTIINMPKPKSHRKAGVTIALKNFVGVNVRKEYLPHHTMGSTQEGGDEYLKKDIIHSMYAGLLDKRNRESYHNNRIKAQFYRLLSAGVHFLHPHKDYDEGSWYGNHTISKTIVDLNKIVMYADMNGVMQKQPARSILIVADMIISGEKEGPVMPSKKNVGIIAVGDNPVCFDEVIATIMGFNYKKIPSIVNAREFVGKYKLCSDELKSLIISNDEKYNGKRCEEIDVKDTMKFEPTFGWKGHIEIP